MNNEDSDTEMFYLGSLCRRNHQFENTEGSLRRSVNSACFDCAGEYTKNYYLKHKEKIIGRGRESRKNYYLKHKEEVFSHYSNGLFECACPEGCSIATIDFLELDHIDGTGGKETKKELSGTKFYYWLEKHNYPKTDEKYFPKGLRLLCSNCNQAMRKFGYCRPHREQKEKIFLKSNGGKVCVF